MDWAAGYYMCVILDQSPATLPAPFLVLGSAEAVIDYRLFCFLGRRL